MPAIGTVADRQTRKQALRQGFGIARGLGAADGAALDQVREPIRRQRRIGERAGKQTDGLGKSFPWGDDTPLNGAGRSAQIDRRAQVSQILDHSATAHAAWAFHDQRGGERGQRLFAGQGDRGPVLPGEIERLRMLVRHVRVAEGKPRRARVPGHGLRAARRRVGRQGRGNSEKNQAACVAHRRASAAGTRVPVTMRPGPESAASTTATCSGDTAATRWGKSASCS